jgi:asparagine synthase (glutamine-hydrolysing)
MCGLFASNDPRVFKASLNFETKLDFRGPDAQSGLISLNGWGLYHSRLSIIGLSDTYNQPFVDSEGNIIVYNGEIFNYKQLGKEKFQIKFESDTHFLSKYLSSGKCNFNELEGFFAFIRVDKFGNLTHAARDKFGVKPLYYFSNSEGNFSFSSEASLLAELYKKNYSQEKINRYKSFRACLTSETLFSDVRSVNPGSCLINGQYFNPISIIEECSDLNFDPNIDLLDEIVESSVNSRLVSDVSIGLLYSGGIDSNLIHAYAPKLSKFTSGQSGDYDLETAEKLSEVNIEIIESSNYLRLAKEMIATKGEPLGVPNEVALASLAKNWSSLGGKVMLSGEAADEFFGGYDKIYSWALRADSFDIDEVFKRYAYSNSKDSFEYFQSLFDGTEHLNPFNRLRAFFVKYHLPVLFRRLDFSLMFAGVEGREPLASEALFRYACSLNQDSLFLNNQGKMPLRLLLKKKSSGKLAFKPKVGFPIDVKKIITGKKALDRKEIYNSWINFNLEEIR